MKKYYHLKKFNGYYERIFCVDNDKPIEAWWYEDDHDQWKHRSKLFLEDIHGFENYHKREITKGELAEIMFLTSL